MKSNATESNAVATPALQVDVGSNHRGSRYQKAQDGRKRPIRGLWVRNGRYYAQLKVEDSNTGTKTTKRVPLLDPITLEPVSTVPQAVRQLERLKTKRSDNELPVLKRTPKFPDYVKNYLAYFETVKDAKRPSTIAKEKAALKLWEDHLGEIRLDRIRRIHINSFIAKRQAARKSARTVNLDVIALRNLLKRAIDDEWIKVLPTANLRPLRVSSKKRQLVTLADVDAICTAAVARKEDGTPVTKNAVQFTDYIRLMSYCGARRNETLRLSWDDVNWELKQLTIGSDGLSKNHEARVVDFNPKLEAHLKEMFSRRAPDSKWLFPSPQRGEKDTPAKTFMESLRLARDHAKMPTFGFHDCRHFFVSYGVMSGVDFMTLARWAGHKDGGVLIGKVYGHLSNEHAKRQAQKVSFE